MRSRRSRGTWIRRPLGASGGQFRLQNGGGPRQRLGARVQLGQVQAPLRQRRTAQQQAAFLGQVFGHILGRALAGLQRAARQPARPAHQAQRGDVAHHARQRVFGIPAQLLGQVGHHLGQRRVAGNMRGLGHVRRLTAGQARQRQFSGETVSVTSGTTAGSDSSASPSLPMVRPSENPPSAKRTVLPAWRTRRSRAQSSRFNSMLSAWVASVTAWAGTEEAA